jgi:hypothetical protein
MHPEVGAFLAESVQFIEKHDTGSIPPSGLERFVELLLALT